MIRMREAWGTLRVASASEINSLGHLTGPFACVVTGLCPVLAGRSPATTRAIDRRSLLAICRTVSLLVADFAGAAARFRILVLRPADLSQKVRLRSMSKSTYPMKLPLSIKKAAQRLAKEDGMSLNQWIAVAVAEKVGVVETAADFFKKRAGKATGEGLMRFLRTAPKATPDAEDTV